MGASVVNKPTAEPVTLAEARAHLRIDSTDSDQSLAAYLLTARRYAETYTRRALISQTWAAKFDYGWPAKIEFPVGPVQSVSSIVYLDENGAEQTLATNQYQLVGTGSEAIACVVPAYDVTWPSVRYVPEAITVQFVAGYGGSAGSVPEEIRTAILLHVEILYDRNPQTAGMLERARDALLDPYRRL